MTYLEFEKPLRELEDKINSLRASSESAGMDVSKEVKSLEVKMEQTRREVYGNLNPWQRVQLARQGMQTQLPHQKINARLQQCQLSGTGVVVLQRSGHLAGFVARERGVDAGSAESFAVHAHGFFRAESSGFAQLLQPSDRELFFRCL